MESKMLDKIIELLQNSENQEMDMYELKQRLTIINYVK